MGTGRNLAIAGIVSGGLILAACLVSKAVAKPPAKGEATLRGTITEAKHLLQIPFATIEFNGVVCTANENGAYRIVEIPLGNYDLTVRAPGYISKTIPLAITEEKAYIRDVALTPVMVFSRRRHAQKGPSTYAFVEEI